EPLSGSRAARRLARRSDQRQAYLGAACRRRAIQWLVYVRPCVARWDGYRSVTGAAGSLGRGGGGWTHCGGDGGDRYGRRDAVGRVVGGRALVTAASRAHRGLAGRAETRGPGLGAAAQLVHAAHNALERRRWFMHRVLDPAVARGDVVLPEPAGGTGFPPVAR